MRRWTSRPPCLLDAFNRSRLYSSKPAPPPSPQSRIARIESRLPRFLQRIVTPLRHAPISHVTSFIILHEITAVVPLLGLTAAFHYGNFLPPFVSEWSWAHEGAARYGKYLRKKGWIKDDQRSGKWFGRGEGGIKIVVELATAYALTKLLLPLRLVVSVWATPWFAKWAILPMVSRLRLPFSRRKALQTKAFASAGAGTNAVGGGALPKNIP